MDDLPCPWCEATVPRVPPGRCGRGARVSLLPYPLACKTARSLVVAWHSHCPDVHHMWAAIGVRQEDEDEPCGAVIVGPPPQEWMGTGIANLVRVVVGPEAPLGACSWLYAAGRKLARALGYPTVVTWTLDGDGVRAAERGTSLLADGWVEVRRGVGGGATRQTLTTSPAASLAVPGGRRGR